jgi:hypothetical protein
MPTPLPTPMPTQIAVGVQPESVWDRLGMHESAVDAPPGEVTDRPRKAGGSVPWLLIAGLVLVVGISVAVLVAVLNRATPKPEPEAVKPEDPHPPVRAFFNGKNLNGWAAKEGYWKVDNGVLTGTFPAGAKPATTFVYSRQAYKDFELSFQVRVPAAGNTGLFFRAEVNRANSFLLQGPECEIDATDCGSLFLKPGEFTAGLPRPEVAALLKKDDFNQVSVRCVGKHVTIKLNGKVTVDAEYDLPAQGVIGWQLNEQHGAHEVQVKDIHFTDLSQPAPR